MGLQTMRPSLVTWLLATLLSGLSLSAPAQIARTEVIAFQSMTLGDDQFLEGRQDGKPVVLAGVLRLPPGTGRVPVAVLLHGSGGISSYVTDWEADYNALGMGTFIVDSFSGRGIVNTNVNQFVLGRLAMIVDAYRALDVLANHPRVDASRVVLMGFSRGGQSALYASLKRFQESYGSRAATFAAYVPLYANCGTTFIDDEDVVDRPVRMFHGSADDYVPVAPCRAYVQRLRAKGRDVQLTEYAGAGHVFDGRAFKTPLRVPNWQTFRSCVLTEKPRGKIVNVQTGQAFANGDACIETGPTVIYNEQAERQVRAAVADFMNATILKK